MSDTRFFVHHIDGEDRIVFANAAWYEFARENGADSLAKESVEGRWLWSYISNRETRQLLQLLVNRVRCGCGKVTIPYRCDSPVRRRFMELQLSLLPMRGVEFRSRMLRVEARDYVALLDCGVTRSGESLRVCSWCKRVWVTGRGWLEVEEAVQVLNLFGAGPIPGIAHGICEKCSRSLHSVTSEEMAAAWRNARNAGESPA